MPKLYAVIDEDGQSLYSKRPVISESDLLDRIGPRLFEVDDKGRVIRECVGWNEKAARLFIADCAEHVLHVFEDSHPGDSRPRAAIATGRAFARGEIEAENMDAAQAAAEAAFGGPGGQVALAAAKVASKRDARAAAWSAAWNAASALHGDAAWDAERAWQCGRLVSYLSGHLGE